jgi:hypothetical protein
MEWAGQLHVQCCIAFICCRHIYHNQQSTMSVSTEDPFNNFINTISNFQCMKGDLDEGFYNGLKEIVNKAMKQVSDHTVEYLHNLDEHQPDEDTLQKIIDNVPSSLSCKDENGYLPIDSAVMSKESVHYVPLLAKEGVKHNVDGDNGRGGLLAGYRNVLRLLVTIDGDGTHDAVYLNAMKELRESNLLRKKDIKEHGLLYMACDHETLMRFDFLADWCPEGLKTHKFSGLPIIHGIIIDCNIEVLSVFLKASLKHYPNDLGLLFQKDSEGQTACERAFEHEYYGKDEILKAIGKLIPFDDPKLPILHHVAKHAPQYLEDFACRYPSATYFRDGKGRTLQQVTLASGHKTFNNNAMYFLQMSDEQVREIDPGNDLYPFMVAASGHTSDLSAVYNLLRRNPSLAHCNKPKRRRKRKRK